LCLISTPSLLVLGPETNVLSKGRLKDVMEDMNNKLLQDFKALKQMHPNTSPGPDNVPIFLPKVLAHYW